MRLRLLRPATSVDCGPIRKRAGEGFHSHTKLVVAGLPELLCLSTTASRILIGHVLPLLCTASTAPDAFGLTSQQRICFSSSAAMTFGIVDALMLLWPVQILPCDGRNGSSSNISVARRLLRQEWSACVVSDCDWSSALRFARKARAPKAKRQDVNVQHCLTSSATAQVPAPHLVNPRATLGSGT